MLASGYKKMSVRAYQVVLEPKSSLSNSQPLFVTYHCSYKCELNKRL